MIRKSTLTLKFGNTEKLNSLRSFLKEYSICVNKFIDLLWSVNKFSGPFVERRLIDKIETSLNFSAKQSAAQETLHIVKSQRKRKQKIKPTFVKQSYNFNGNFIQILESNNSFGLWIKFTSMGFKKPISIPTKKHKQFNKFTNDGWTLKQCGRNEI